MRLLWGALRAVSVETLGVLVVLWMLYGATGLAIDAPSWATKSPQLMSERNAVADRQIARVETDPTGIRPTDLAAQKTAREATQRASIRQWFDTLFPTDLDETPATVTIEQRAKYTQERLDYYSKLFGIATPNSCGVKRLQTAPSGCR
jgi:hypothetical protein